MTPERRKKYKKNRAALKIRLCEAQNHRCCHNGCPLTYENPEAPSFATFEHVVEKRKGGIGNWDNLVISCKKCNNEREKMDKERTERFWKIFLDCEYKNWEYALRFDGVRPYLQIRAAERCAITGQSYTWTSRKWMLSWNMTTSEIVQTVFLATQVALEHEFRETFKYKKVPIFQPHYNVETLKDLYNKGHKVLDLRKEKNS